MFLGIFFTLKNKCPESTRKCSALKLRESNEMTLTMTEGIQSRESDRECIKVSPETQPLFHSLQYVDFKQCLSLTAVIHHLFFYAYFILLFIFINHIWPCLCSNSSKRRTLYDITVIMFWTIGLSLAILCTLFWRFLVEIKDLYWLCMDKYIMNELYRSVS